MLTSITVLGMALLAHVDEARHDEVAAIVDLDAILDAQIIAATAEWPDVHLDAELYVRHLADKIAARAGEPAADVISAMPAGDLYLALACGLGNEAALSAFRATFAPALREVLGKIGAPRATIDETEQRLLIMLFVGENDGPPQILGYSGRGRLRSWVRSVAVRTGRRLMGVEHGGADNADELERVHGLDDPEAAMLRNRYRDQFRTAFHEAVASLTDRERILLRQYHLDGLTIDRLAALYKVDRATTARWVKAARLALLEATKARLAASLAIGSTDVESVIRLVRSQLDMTVGELFGKRKRR